MDAVGPLRNNVPNTASPSKAKMGGADNLAQPQNRQVQDSDGDRDNSFGESSVKISADALQLASTSVTPPVSNQTQIPDQEKANQVLARVTEQIRNNPGQAQLAVSSASSTDSGRRLAEKLLSA